MSNRKLPRPTRAAESMPTWRELRRHAALSGAKGAGWGFITPFAVALAAAMIALAAWPLR